MKNRIIYRVGLWCIKHSNLSECVGFHLEIRRRVKEIMRCKLEKQGAGQNVKMEDKNRV